MELSKALREALVNNLETFLDALSDTPDPEMVATYVIDQLETYADERGIDDIVVELEESGALDGSLQDTLEEEMSSNADFEFTEEEVVSLLERVGDIEWVDHDDFDDEDDEFDEDDEEF
ncbi:MAG: hypothetical protein ACON4N_03605 [Myxococcota bacterium]